MGTKCTVLQIVMLTSSWLVGLSSSTCPLGWFGSRCQFSCHCVSDDCSDTGDCHDDVECAPTWFGLGCQYQDMLTFPTATVRLNPKQSSHEWLTDNDGTTCNTAPDLESITVHWSVEYIFTWLQFRVKDNAAFRDIEIKFKGSTPSTVRECRNKELVNLTSRLFEIHCEAQGAITEMTLEGDHVPKLCSLNVNGGRNVALKQNTTQSEADTPANFPSDLAVDGNTIADFAEQSCTLTHVPGGKVKPTWNLTFDQSYLVTTFVLYGNADEFGKPVSGFRLQTFDADDALVFSHVDNGTGNGNVVEVLNNAWMSPIRRVSITANVIGTFENKSILTLCEVETFAECVPGSHGLECGNCSDICFRSACQKDGLCTLGCAGYRDPPKCITPCVPGTWGLNCKHYCKSVHCLDNVCHKDTGLCHYGCKERSDFPQCSLACLPGQFGANCSQNCDHCEHRLCDHMTAYCELSCCGYDNPPYCTNECSKHYWGPNCLRQCSHHCRNMTCDRRSGRCDQGCTDGYWSDDCTKGIKGYQEKSSYKTLKIFLIILLIVLILASAIVWRRREKIKAVKDRSILVKYLNEFMKKHSKSYFEKEFQEISSPEDVTCDVALMKENRLKNTDTHVLAYDHSRVILKYNKERNEGDYINASFTKGFRNNGKYIAAQAPTSFTINDFIRMLWEQRTDVVVMLTKLIENDEVMSEKYWPDNETELFGVIEVGMISEERLHDYSIRSLALRKDNESRIVTQYQFTSWPVDGVPERPWALVEFEQRVSLHTTNKAIVVHCWSGVGRTGIFIALHNARTEAQTTGKVDFFKMITDLREDRAVIETAEQYWFVHTATQVAVLAIDRTLTKTNISEKLKNLSEVALEEEYKAVCAMADTFKIIDRDKNSEDIFFSEAAFIETFKNSPPHILCPIPHNETIETFLQLLLSYRVALIVEFPEDDLNFDNVTFHYLPTNDAEPVIDDPEKICSNNNNKTHTTQVWGKQEIDLQFEPGMTLSLTHVKACFVGTDPINLCIFVQHAQKEPVLPSQTTLFMCRTGSLLSGLACVLSLLLDRWNHGSCLSVPLVVGSVKSVKPDVIPTLGQYKTLYDALQAYLQIKSNGTE